MKGFTKQARWLWAGGVVLLAFWGWQMGDRSPSAANRWGPVTAGPESDPLCGPDGKPLPPAPVDSAFGRHFYPLRSKGEVHAVAFMEAVAGLGLPGQDEPNYPPNGRRGSNEDASQDVQTLDLLIGEFLRIYGSVPPGELNEEIVRGLQGENMLGIALLPKVHPTLSAAGELLDRWGTPYRFHPESRWQLTVRSAGPDRRMWTSDDVLSEAGPGRDELDSLISLGR